MCPKSTIEFPEFVVQIRYQRVLVPRGLTRFREIEPSIWEHIKLTKLFGLIISHSNVGMNFHAVQAKNSKRVPI